ncbi:MAG: ABC transporter ATP-binding protein [Verrucomicrobiota bacterium]
MSEPIIEVVGLQKVFRDFWRRPKVKAVNDVSFTVKRGEVFGLLGPNGSGKSTTLKMILGLLYPTSGQVRVLGRSPRDVKTKARIGYLPEESYSYPYLTSQETLTFYGMLFDLPAGERRVRTEQLLDMIGLRHARRRQVGEFSKGMARRIGLAQALINDPDLVILDEPTSGLDPIGCRQVKDLIRALAARGKTVLLSSHLLSDVEDVCDRVIILYNGKVQALGTINELLEQKTQYRLTMPEVSAAGMERILAAVRAELGNEPTVDHPRRDLEQFFLEVVEKARQSTTEASGVGPASGVAKYLAGDEALQHLVAQPAAPVPLTAEQKQAADEKLRKLVEPSK